MSDMNRLDSVVAAAGRVFDRRLAAAPRTGVVVVVVVALTVVVATVVLLIVVMLADEQGPGEAPAASTPPTNSPREGSPESFVQGLRAYQSASTARSAKSRPMPRVVR